MRQFGQSEPVRFLTTYDVEKKIKIDDLMRLMAQTQQDSFHSYYQNRTGTSTINLKPRKSRSQLETMRRFVLLRYCVVAVLACVKLVSVSASTTAGAPQIQVVVSGIMSFIL